jgi:hypothetical protein
MNLRFIGLAAGLAANDRLSAGVEQLLTVERSGWVALRVSGPPHRDQPGGLVFGHTSAVYIEVVDRPIDASADARYFLTWIDRLAGDIRRRDRVPSRSRPPVESQLAASRTVFENEVTGP